MLETTSSPTVTPTDPYRAHFERFTTPAAREQPAWVLPVRAAGLARFAELGFPTLQDEDWRFTNVAPIAKLPFQPVLAADGAGVNASALAAFAFSKLAGARLVFVDGHFSAALSTTGALPAGARVGSLAAALRDQPAALEAHLSRYAQTGRNAFAALNTAFFQDGAFFFVPAGQTVREPVQLVYLSTAKAAGATTHPRNLIVAEAGSHLTVIESYVSLGAATGLTNAVTELVAGDGAVVEHLKFQDESAARFHVALLHARLGRSTNFIFHSIALGARISRNNIRTHLAGEGLECVLNGLYLTRGEQIADHHMVVEHAQPRCASHEYFNGILDDKSKGVFHGRILVQRAAQKTDAKQTNKNLLLSDDATADTKPQLEIYADDVKCTHGATVGQLNDESIFYLRARGIGLERARRMLMHGFAGEIIDRVRCAPVREELDQLVWDRLEQQPAVAVNQ